MAIDEAKFRYRFPLWSLAEIGQMTEQEWLMACCPRHLRNCPAVVDEDDELICPICSPGRK